VSLTPATRMVMIRWRAHRGVLFLNGYALPRTTGDEDIVSAAYAKTLTQGKHPMADLVGEVDEATFIAPEEGS